MLKLNVNASRSYDITITKGFSGLSAAAEKFCGGKIALITDENVDKLFSDDVLNELKGFEVVKFVIEAGEKSKNGENFLSLVNGLAEHGFQRRDAVFALGGGVVGDLAGFTASAYMRGITLVALPTSLLAAVDSSVGGKTAIDLPAGKNLCGSFYQPFAVYINADCFRTLPQKEKKNGLGEVVKYALLDRRVTLESMLEGFDEQLVYDCLSVKRDVVQADEFEGGKRMILNLGHTVGHAVEKLADYTLSHGECVAKGLAAAIAVSKKLYGLSGSEVEKMRKVLTVCDFDLSLGFGADEISDCISRDKKSEGDEVNFVALKGIGEPRIEKIKIKELRKILSEYYGN